VATGEVVTIFALWKALVEDCAILDYAVPRFAATSIFSTPILVFELLVTRQD
jgi:hypothetical protein